MITMKKVFVKGAKLNRSFQNVRNSLRKMILLFLLDWMTIPFNR